MPFSTMLLLFGQNWKGIHLGTLPNQESLCKNWLIKHHSN